MMAERRVHYVPAWPPIKTACGRLLGVAPTPFPFKHTETLAAVDCRRCLASTAYRAGAVEASMSGAPSFVLSMLVGEALDHYAKTVNLRRIDGEGEAMFRSRIARVLQGRPP